MLFYNLGSPAMWENASFSKFVKRDVNPLGGTQKTRVLYNPNKTMGELHRRFRQNLLQLDIDLASATAVRKSSARANVGRHRFNRYFFITDIADAFRNVDIGRLARVLAMHDRSNDVTVEKVQSFLERYCRAHEGGLITGSPSSNDLFNIYTAWILDRPMREYCEPRGIVYSRYMDDLTFSSHRPIGVKMRRRIREIVAQAGFSIGHHKSRVLDLAKQSIEINGIGLEYGGRLYLPRWYLRKMMGLVGQIRRTRDARLVRKLRGMVGLFWAVTGRGTELNRIEQRTVESCEATLGGDFRIERPAMIVQGGAPRQVVSRVEDPACKSKFEWPASFDEAHRIRSLPRRL